MRQPPHPIFCYPLGLKAILAVAALPMLFALAPATRPTESPDVKAVRDQMVEWDKTQAKVSAEESRKWYYSDNQKESRYLDFVAGDTLEEAKAQQAVLDKWGVDAEAKFAHLLAASTIDDDKQCTIKVDGDHATASWDNIPGSSALSLVKVNGHWFIDGHAMYAEAVKADPTQEPDMDHAMAPLMKQAMKDIADGKFDSADGFIDDFKAKLTPPGN